MAYKSHGKSITALPMLHPGSNFTITESGFDTGSRKFIVDRNALPNILPARNTADTSIQFTIGNSITRRGNYSGMYVSSVSNITEMRNDLAEYTVSYLGLVKPGKVPYTRNGTSFTVIPATGGITIAPSSSVQTGTESLPTLTRTYVTNRQPDPNGLGAIGAAFFELIAITPRHTSGATLGGPAVSRGWILSNREVRTCGPLYEVADTYNYIIQR